MLYLVRHGSTSQPLLRVPGDLTPATHEEWLLDHGLSSRGQAEACTLRERLAHFDPAPERFLASPRRRTQETALAALPEAKLEIDERLHEWWEGESMEALHARTRWLLGEAQRGQVVAAFTHGGFIRATIAALLVGDDHARFGATFQDLRRVLHVWNCSVTVVGHGAQGLELLGVNLCHPLETITGRP